MSIEKVYSAVKDSENGEELKGILDTIVGQRNELEKENRTLKTAQKEIEGLDLGELKASLKFIQDNGGMDSVIDSISKGNGAADAQAENERLKAEHAKQVEAITKESEAYKEAASRANLVATVQGEFNKTFRNVRGLLLDDAINSKYISVNEQGVPIVTVNGNSKPYNDGGMSLLAEHPDYKPDKISPSGSNEPLDAPSNENNGNGSSHWWNPNNN